MEFTDVTGSLWFGSNETTLLIFVLIFLLVYFSTRKPYGIPPSSPFTLPIVGDLPLIAVTGSDLLVTFRKLRRQHGDIFSFYIGNDLTVVVNGFELVHKAAVRHGWKFSGRPENFINNVITNGRGVILANGSFWKRQRKFAVSCLQEFGFGKRSFEQNIMYEMECLADILREQNGKPFDIKDALKAAVENILFTILFSKRHNFNSEFYQKHLRHSDIISRKMTDVSMLLSCFPILQHLPGDILGVNLIKTLYKDMENYLDDQYHEHVKAREEGNPRDFMDMFITEMNKSENQRDDECHSDFTVDQMAFLIMDLFGAGTDTTASTLRFAILFLLQHPEIKERLHSDIDSIIPNSRHPTLEDKDKLPYVEAFIMEIQRFANVTPLAVPHRVTSEDDAIFEGYRIPKNTTVIFNIDSIFTDPNSFENPMLFDPKRFLAADGRVVKPKEWIPFSLGRRVCLGEAVAKMELFLFLTSLIQHFVFRPVDANNVPRTEKELGMLINRQKPFEIKAMPRVHVVE